MIPFIGLAGQRPKVGHSWGRNASELERSEGVFSGVLGVGQKGVCLRATERGSG